MFECGYNLSTIVVVICSYNNIQALWGEAFGWKYSFVSQAHPDPPSSQEAGTGISYIAIYQYEDE